MSTFPTNDNRLGRWELARTRLPRYNPNKLTRVGWNIYVDRNPDTRDLKMGQLAQKDLDLLLNLDCEPGSTEEKFWSDLTDHVNSFGAGLMREVRFLNRRQQAATGLRQSELERFRTASRHGWAVTALFAVGRSFLLFMFGYLLSQAFPSIMQRFLKGQTDDQIASALLGVLLIVVVQMVRGLIAIWKAEQRTLAEEEYQRSMRAADRENLKGNMLQLEKHWVLFCQAWAEYDGERYDEEPWYLEMMEAQLAAHDRWDAQMERQSRRGLRRVVRFVTRVVMRRKYRRAMEVAVIEEEVRG